MFLRSIGILALVSSFVGNAHGADTKHKASHEVNAQRKEAALKFLDSIGGQVRVTKELRLSIACYSHIKKITALSIKLIPKELKNEGGMRLNNLGLNPKVEGVDVAYNAFYQNGVLDFNIDFDLLEKAEKKRLGKAK